MIDDEIGDEFQIFTNRTYGTLITEPRVNLGVINWIEPCVCTVDRKEEREQMHTPEQS